MSTIPERLEKLRAKMQEKGIDIYIIPTADFHQSEYVGEHFKAREYITGFTGSAGTAVVSKTEARLWTDGRYFIPVSYTHLDVYKRQVVSSVTSMEPPKTPIIF